MQRSGRGREVVRGRATKVPAPLRNDQRDPQGQHGGPIDGRAGAELWQSTRGKSLCSKLRVSRTVLVWRLAALNMAPSGSLRERKRGCQGQSVLPITADLTFHTNDCRCALRALPGRACESVLGAEPSRDRHAVGMATGKGSILGCESLQRHA